LLAPGLGPPRKKPRPDWGTADLAALVSIRRQSSGLGRPVSLRVNKPGIGGPNDWKRRKYAPIQRQFQRIPPAKAASQLGLI
jgi:hypothetical protein